MATSTFKWEDKSWNILNYMFQDKRRLVQHNLNSFNNFMKKDIHEIINEEDVNPISEAIDFSPDKSIKTVEYQVKITNIYFSRPVINESNGIVRQMYPNDARLRNLTYSAGLFADFEHCLIKRDPKTGEIIDTIKYPTLEKHSIGKIPIMIRSDFCILHDKTPLTRSEMDECEYDEGGYFVVQGGERVIINLEKRALNKPNIFTVSRTKRTRFSHMCEISSLLYGSRNVPKMTRVMYSAKGNSSGFPIYASINRFKPERGIPLFVLFRALGVITDKEIVDMIVPNKSIALTELLRASIEEAEGITTQQQAMEYLALLGPMGNKLKFTQISPEIQTDEEENRKSIYAITINSLNKEFIPHVGTNPRKKAYFLAYMTNKLLLHILGIIGEDDRDSFLNKRIETAGELLAVLFRENYIKMIRSIKSDIIKDIKAGRTDELSLLLSKRIKPNTIETGMKYSLLTGNWGIKNKTNNRVGVAQTLPRLTNWGTLSNLRRVISYGLRDTKLASPRMLHSTQYGYICPAETPEGGNVGLVKNMALTSDITVNMNQDPVIQLLKDCGMRPLEEITPYELIGSNGTKIFLNGDWIGVHNGKILYDTLIKNRRDGVINPYIGICWDCAHGEIRIHTDNGRLIRPLYVIDDNKYVITNKMVDDLMERKISFNELVTKGVIEYIDMEEANNVMIAMNSEDLMNNSKKNSTYNIYTHSEIHPAFMLGVLACNIPYSEHNQAPRNLFQGAMGKQALGLYATNYRKRMDTTSFVLDYPQLPLCTTRMAYYVNTMNIPPGEISILAIAVQTGFNQEDSLIFNKGSIDRGFMGSTMFKTYVAEEKKSNSSIEDESICKPLRTYPDGKIKTIGMRSANYDKLDENGFIKIGETVEQNDVIIGKIVPIKDAIEGEAQFRDASEKITKGQEGVVDWLYVNKNEGGYRIAKVRIRTHRKPVIGNKFASSHANKGTISIIFNEKDMPYTRNGIKPDMIMSPHALPKRMTIAHLIECAGGKIATHLGTTLDATPFTGQSVHDIADILPKCGYHESGKEFLYDGRTGKRIMARIFIGPMFYYCLKHMVADKIHSRLTGPYQTLTRQPAEGRNRGGGLRIGEMEENCMVGHGAMRLFKERTFDNSDKFQFYVCNKTGFIAAVNPSKNIYKSLYDPSNTNDFSKVQVPYATKLFIQELMSMGIAPRLFT